MGKGDTRWFVHDRFGMFIHWGLYSLPARHEWIRNIEKIPNEAYEIYFEMFNPDLFDPKAWAKAAREAGMKYFVITTKHHEGFCLWDTKYTDYKVTNTAAGRDLLREVVDAFRAEGLKVGFYYSLLDWHHPDFTIDRLHPLRDLPPEEIAKLNSTRDMKRYAQYMRDQVTELLTNYGKIDLLWYDTPLDLTKEQSEAFVDVVRELQPECIINGRVGYDLGDYGPLGDNEMPCASADRDLEMVATMNHTWGYKKNDQDWKSPKDILCSLIECASRGVNYVVNVGPKADGTIPQPSMEIMDFIGGWMKANAESIYGTTANPFNDNFPWGFVTRKDNVLYLHLQRRPAGGCIVLKGMLSPVEKATVLSTGKDAFVSCEDICRISVPDGLDYERVPVLKLTCKEPVHFSDANYMNEGIISIPVAGGNVVPGAEGQLDFSEGRVTQNFHSGMGKIRMKCEVDSPGTYLVRVFTSRHWRRSFAEGARITLRVGGHSFESVPLEKSGELENVRQNSYPETWSDIGTVSFSQEGTVPLELSVDETGTFSRLGFFGEDIQNESDNNIRFMRIELVRQER